MFIRLLLCAVLIGVTGTASAQQSTRETSTSAQAPTRQLSDQQRAAIQKQNQVLATYAQQLVVMVDRGQIGALWDEASPVAKQAVARDQFIQTTKADRERLGEVTSRKVARVTRSVSKGGKLPAGSYISVNFATRFSKHDKPVRELMSFHLDKDKKWRLSGYTVRPAHSVAGVAADQDPD